MSVKPIVIYPSKILRQKCKEVDFADFDNEAIGDTMFFLVTKMLEDMEDTLEEVDKGAALAANQIGYDIQAFVTNQDMTTRSDDEVVRNIPPYVINPVIIKKSPERDLLNEGCLSFPNFSVQIQRHIWVEVKYDTVLRINGKWAEHHIQETYTGFWAQVFQHEIDHLNGKLFVDALPERKRIEIANYITKNKGKK